VLKHEVALKQGLIKQLSTDFAKIGIALHFYDKNKIRHMPQTRKYDQIKWDMQIQYSLALLDEQSVLTSKHLTLNVISKPVNWIIKKR